MGNNRRYASHSRFGAVFAPLGQLKSLSVNEPPFAIMPSGNACSQFYSAMPTRTTQSRAATTRKVARVASVGDRSCRN